MNKRRVNKPNNSVTQLLVIRVIKWSSLKECANKSMTKDLYEVETKMVAIDCEWFFFVSYLDHIQTRAAIVMWLI